MKYSIGQKIRHFIVESAAEVKEIGGDLYILRHEGTGSLLCYVDNDDRNMVYSVTFPTPSENSTGVFHILEHSVLCGSERFPVADPFVELMKGSLYTFLNAMTFPDKTMYPVASQNEKDLINLMAVYTDAVFKPLIYQNEIAFRQEGWHIEVDEDGKPYYQGVVYNEMKGALGDPDEVLFTTVMRESFEECQYSHIFGGHPDEVVRLTYEDFIANHKRYYHPSNARFYLYGKMDLEEKLRFLDEEYLSRCERGETLMEPPVALKKQTAPKFVSYHADEPEGEDYIAFSYPIAYLPSYEQLTAAGILSEILAGSNYAPLKKRILDKQLAVELSCSVTEETSYPLFTIKLEHTDAQKREEIEREINDCLRELAENGVDRDMIRAQVSTAEFALREGNTGGIPKGLYYGILIADSWLNGGEPERYLKYESALEAIKAGIDDGYFERMIRDLLLSNDYRSVVVMEATRDEKRYTEPDCLPDDYEAELTEDDSAIPHLKLEDVERDVIPTATRLSDVRGKTVLLHPIKTDGIVYERLYFDISGADDDELFYTSLLSTLLTALPTAHYSGEQLQTRLGLCTGGMSFSTVVCDCDDSAKIAVMMGIKAIAERFDDANDLAEEIIYRSLLDDKAILRDLIVQQKKSMELGIINNSSQLAMTRAAATYAPAEAFRDKLAGVDYYERLRDLAADIDAVLDTVIEKLAAVYDKYILSGHAVLSLTADEAILTKAVDGKLLCESSLTDDLMPAMTATLPGNLALMAPCDIVFNGYSADISAAEEDCGRLFAARQILSLEYLWDVIRVKNGAYGCGAVTVRDERLGFWSYRDPQIRSTLDCFEGAGDFLSGLSLSTRELEDYIIGCVRGLDRPLTPSQEGYIADVRYFSAISDDLRREDRENLLGATLDDVHRIGERIRSLSRTPAFCTVGDADKIEASRDLYDRITKL